jgi:hypothetical protein
MLRTGARTTWLFCKLVDARTCNAIVQHVAETNYHSPHNSAVVRTWSDLIRSSYFTSGFSSSSVCLGGDSESRNFPPRDTERPETQQQSSPAEREHEQEDDRGEDGAGDGDIHLRPDPSREDVSEASTREFEEHDDFLERWSELLEENDFEGVRQLLEQRLSSIPGADPDEFLARVRGSSLLRVMLSMRGKVTTCAGCTRPGPFLLEQQALKTDHVDVSKWERRVTHL